MSQKPSIQFLGATKTVTGSKTLIKASGKKILVDCGLFQGPKRQVGKDIANLSYKNGLIRTYTAEQSWHTPCC